MPLVETKLGVAFYRGLGVIVTAGNFNGFIGNDGAVDYTFKKDTLKLELKGAVTGMLAVAVMQTGTVITVSVYL